jgi:hypothetical protein
MSKQQQLLEWACDRELEERSLYAEMDYAYEQEMLALQMQAYVYNKRRKKDTNIYMDVEYSYLTA